LNEDLGKGRDGDADKDQDEDEVDEDHPVYQYTLALFEYTVSPHIFSSTTTMHRAVHIPPPEHR
jgi:hypothetical protein